MEIQTNNNSRLIIGKGSYGTVSLGVHETDAGTELFAVKSAAKNSVSSIDALENEIEVLRAISSSSPFIVKFYGEDESPSHRNLYLEYVSGGDVSRSGGVSEVELIRSYTWCLVTALKSVHSEGYVHSDIKGSNVLLCGDSDSGIAKLADFGSAKKNRLDGDQRSKIVPRGSPLWMAPEVVRGESQGFESDIWSLGCTIIEMFTGKPAWQDNGAHTLYKIGYSNDLPEYPAQLPDLARNFLDKCLNRNPNLRWSCDQLQQHPFLLPTPASKIIEFSSPRSILDWEHSLEFSGDESEISDGEVSISNSISDRFGKLATTAGVIWESDGWLDVRGVSAEIVELRKGENGITESVNWEDECDCDTWVNMDGEDERGGECDHGSWWCQSGEADSCGGLSKDKLQIAVFFHLFFYSFLFYFYCLLLRIFDILIIITIFLTIIVMLNYFCVKLLILVGIKIIYRIKTNIMEIEIKLNIFEYFIMISELSYIFKSLRVCSSKTVISLLSLKSY